MFDNTSPDLFNDSYFIYVKNVLTSSTGNFEIANIIENDNKLLILYSQSGTATALSCNSALIQITTNGEVYDSNDIDVLFSSTQRIFVNSSDDSFHLYFLSNYEMLIIHTLNDIEYLYISPWERNEENNIELENILIDGEGISLIIENDVITFNLEVYTEE